LITYAKANPGNYLLRPLVRGAPHTWQESIFRYSQEQN